MPIPFTAPLFDMRAEFAPLTPSFTRLFLSIVSPNLHVPAPFLARQEADMTLRFRAFLRERAFVYFHVAPLVLSGEKITKGWVRKKVFFFDPRREKRAPTDAAINDWLVRGLLKKTGHGRPDVNSAISILLLRSFNNLDRSWLPGMIDEKEDAIYAWGIAPDALVPQPYRLPLSEDIPGDTLLYSPWAGLPWSFPGFRSVWAYGSIGWAGYDAPNARYTLSFDQYQRWSEVAELPLETQLFPRTAFFGDATPLSSSASPYEAEYLHALATDLLYRLGGPLLFAHLRHFYGGSFPRILQESEHLCLPFTR